MPPAKKPMAKPSMKSKPKSKFAPADSKEEKRRIEAIRKTRSSAGKSGLMNSAVVSQPKKPKSTRPVMTNINAPKIKPEKRMGFYDWLETPSGRTARSNPDIDITEAYAYDTGKKIEAGIAKKRAVRNKEIMRVQKKIVAKPKMVVKKGKK
jgi:hypothetical protein